jgi:hypothetical protein
MCNHATSTCEAERSRSISQWHSRSLSIPHVKIPEFFPRLWPGQARVGRFRVEN